MNATHTILNRSARAGLAVLMLLATLLMGGVAPTLAAAPGTLVGWGNNVYGQTTIPAGLSSVTAIDGGYYHSLALKSDGTVVAWGRNSLGQSTIPAGLSSVTAIAGGGSHSLALKSDGTVVAWGYNLYGQTTIPAGLSGVTAIAAGQLYSLALKGDGTVVAWGYGFNGETSVPGGLSGVTAISAGFNHSLALKSDGTVVAWGDNHHEQTTIPAGLSGVTAIAAGDLHSLALKSDGTVVAWGSNLYGQLNIPAGLSGVTAIVAGGYHNLALKSDGAVVAWGDNFFGQSTIPAGLNNVTAISAGRDHSLVISSDTTPPVITSNVVGTLGSNGWYLSDVTVSWSVVDDESAITSQTGCDPTTINTDTAGTTLTCTATSAGGTSSQSVTIMRDATTPGITFANRTAPNANGWNNTDVVVNWNCDDGLSGAAAASVSQTLTSEGANQSATGTCSDLAGNSASDTQTGINIDTTAPTITASTTNADGTPYTAPDWTNQHIIVHFTCSDTGSGIADCPVDQAISAEGSLPAVQGTASDTAGNSADAFAGPFQIDLTKPTISGSRTPAANAAGWNNSAVTVSFSCADNTNGSTIGSDSVAGATVSSEGSNQSVTNTGACVDAAGNAADAATVGGINIDTAAPSTSGSFSTAGTQATVTLAAGDSLSGVASTSYSVNGGAAQIYSAPFVLSGVGTYTISYFSTDTAGNAETAKTLSVTISAPANGILDNFNRANGGVGSNWDGLSGTSFYKIATNKLDVQVGGPLVWKPTSFGTSQEAFVTLSTIDSRSPSQGVLLKVQTGSIPNAGAISVVYDAIAKAVRVSTLRLGTNGAWTLYANKPATFANGDKLGARAMANGDVQILKNGTLIATVTLNAVDKSFFNAKGGKIGIWTAAAPNALFDDFGGGTVTP